MVAMQAASIHCGVCLQTADNDLPLPLYIRGEGGEGGGGKYLIDAPNSCGQALVLNQC